MTSRVFCCQQVDDVPPYITVPPYTTTVWGVSAPDAFYPKNSVAEQADVSQPYGGGSPAMGGWFSAVCYTFGRRLYRHFDGTVPIGLVDASWGGKTIESFAPPTAMVRFRPRLPLNSIPPVLEYRNTTQITPPNH